MAKGFLMSSKNRVWRLYALSVALLLGASVAAQEPTPREATPQEATPEGPAEGIQPSERPDTFDLPPLSSSAVPQYQIANAEIYIRTAVETAAVLDDVQRLSIQDVQVIGEQAEFLVIAIERALDSLAALEENAQDTNPDAILPIREAMASLVAARAQARTVLDLAEVGEMGPTYSVNLREARNHLRDAESLLRDISREYSVRGLYRRSYRYDSRYNYDRYDRDYRRYDYDRYYDRYDYPRDYYDRYYNRYRRY